MRDTKGNYWAIRPALAHEDRAMRSEINLCFVGLQILID